MAVQDGPEVVRVVASSRRVEPALVALLAMVALIGMATWKPWTNALDGPLPASPADLVVRPEVGSPAPMSAADPAEVIVEGIQPVAALDISHMGVIDRHGGWGVAAAYVPITRVAVAARKRLPSVTPLVEWKAIEPGHRVEIPGSAQAVATVALAVTWPSRHSPRDIRLFYRSPAVQNGPELSVRPRTREMSLLRPLPGIAMFGWQANGEAVDASEAAWSHASGVFYLPPSDPLPTRPREWLKSGWPTGTYEFRVTDADGTVVVRFWLRGSSQ